jgi:predicted AAA+ superfamily ATPase
MTDYLPRLIVSRLATCLAEMPVVVLTGLRQSGKTTLLQQDPTLGKRRYVSLDDFAHLSAAQQNPEALLGDGQPVTIDEAQRCPELFPVIKRLVDRDRTPGRFLLSGSANLALLQSMSESLAGRAIYLSLLPFTLREISGPREDEPFLRRFFDETTVPSAFRTGHPALSGEQVVRGGMPTVCLHQVRDPAIWFQGFEQTYLERDLRQLSQVADLVSFRNLFRLAALRTGQVLKVSELARDARLNAATAGRYLNLMETSFLVSRLPPYLANRASRVIKSPKLYLADAGWACHVAGITDLPPDTDEPLRGALFETFVAQNLAGIVAAGWPMAELFFWHVQGRHEVDFVLAAGRECLAIEVKAASRWNPRDLSGLRAFLAATPHCRAAILAYNGPDVVQLDARLWAIPLTLLLS